MELDRRTTRSVTMMDAIQIMITSQKEASSQMVSAVNHIGARMDEQVAMFQVTSNQVNNLENRVTALEQKKNTKKRIHKKMKKPAGSMKEEPAPAKIKINGRKKTKKVRFTETNDEDELQTPRTASAATSTTPGVDLTGLEMLDNGKFRCPRCFRPYAAGYLLVHLSQKKKPCVAKP